MWSYHPSRSFRSVVALPAIRGARMTGKRTVRGGKPAGVAALLLLVAGLASARPAQGASFTSYVPAEAAGYIRTRSLAAFDSLLGDFRAGELLSTLTGHVNARAIGVSWSMLLDKFLGSATSIDQAYLMSVDAAVVLDSWQDPTHMVWFFRLGDASLLNRWFPKERRTAQNTSRTDLMFRTEDGLIVALHGDVLVLARRWADDRLLIEIIQLLTGRHEASLAAEQKFHELRTYLPPDAVATVYALQAPRAMPLAWTLGTNGERLIAGLYTDGDRVDVAIRGATATPVSRADIDPSAVGQLMRLPRTTLFAMLQARTLDPRSLAGGSTSGLSRLARLLVTMGRRTASGHAEKIDIGPHVVLAWGQSIGNDDDFPELAVLVECADATGLKENVDDILTNVLSTLTRRGSESAARPTIRHESYLGIPFSVLPAISNMPSDQLGMLEILKEVQPAWAAWGDWMILSTHRSYLERILDAQFGLIPTLGSLPDARFIHTMKRGTVLVAVAQTTDVANQIDAWLDGPAGVTPSWLDPLWWDKVLGVEPFAGPSLGIKLDDAFVAGGLLVQATFPTTAAAGHFHPGDRIFGFNGRTLDLAEPRRDFRQAWRRRNGAQPAVFRVLRQGKLLDVVLDPVGDAHEPVPEFNPKPWLRQLATVVRSIASGNLALHVTDDRHYSARMTLHKRSPATAARP